MKTAVLSLPLSLVLFACGSAESTTTAVPTSPEGSPSPEAASGPHWMAPEGWVEQPVESSMRFKQFILPGAGDSEEALCVIAHWPGGIGPMESNLDRWVGQVSPAESQLQARDLTPDQRWVTELDGYVVTTVLVEGAIRPMPGMASDAPTEEAGAILAGFIEVRGSNEVWSVKITGPAKTVEAHKDRYLQLIAGI